MIHTIIPVKNEEKKIASTLEMVLKTYSDKIIVVLNGCEDDSQKVVENYCHEKVDYIYFNKSLGIDIPRVIGAQLAIRDNTEGIVFVDGDMNGRIEKHINKIIVSLKEKRIDMALTNCYPTLDRISAMASILLYYRKLLNNGLGLFNKIGYSIPSHGPHGVSRRLLENIALKELAIPPVSLALAVKNNLHVDVATTIPAALLPTTTRDEFHALQISKTIIGDCIEAMEVFLDKKRTRSLNGYTYMGYHKNRRFDLLESFHQAFYNKND